MVLDKDQLLQIGQALCANGTELEIRKKVNIGDGEEDYSDVLFVISTVGNLGFIQTTSDYNKNDLYIYDFKNNEAYIPSYISLQHHSNHIDLNTMLARISEALEDDPDVFVLTVKSDLL